MGRARAGGQAGHHQLLRWAALALVLAVMPLALAAGSLLQDAPFAQAFARLSVTADEVAVVADRVLRTELAVRPVPDDVADGIVEPIVRAALRPTVREDAAATERAHDEAAGQVEEVQHLTRADLTEIVTALCRECVEDGQLDEAPITLRDLATVQRSFIETLSGVYHPRIAYPPKPGTELASAAAAPAPAPAAPATPRP